MARRRRSRPRSPQERRQLTDPYLVTVERVLSVNARPPRRPARSRLNALTDRRLWSPHRYRPIAVLGRKTGFKPRRSLRRAVPRGLAFINPRHVIACARRAVRKQVMHAIGGAGSKRVARKPKRRNELSSISCKG